jgi:orotate phosphoribosyltransferase
MPTLTHSAALGPQEFVAFAVDCGVLRFGEFQTKAGRISPYFFNAGLFDDGAKLGRLAEFYASALISSGLPFDMLFGPAYKGISLAAAVAIELSRQGRNVPFAFNRKEAKNHGEGGSLVGAPLKGRVVRESVELIQAAGALPVGVAIALDRQEKACIDGGEAPWSAVQFVSDQWGLQVVSIAALSDLMHYLTTHSASELAGRYAALSAYRDRYGV